jgi:hypothetical protein
MTRVYCDCLNCDSCKKIEIPVKLNFDNEHYKGFDNSVFRGKCFSSEICFVPGYFDSESFYREYSACNSTVHLIESQNTIVKCFMTSCAWNDGKKCTRAIIFCNRDNLVNDITCKSYSQKKIKGHRDWFSILNPDGTAKGGHIDDAYAKKLDAEARKFKMFSDGHHRDANPRVPKRG